MFSCKFADIIVVSHQSRFVLTENSLLRNVMPFSATYYDRPSASLNNDIAASVPTLFRLVSD